MAGRARKRADAEVDMTDSVNSTGVQAGGAAALQLNTERQTPSVSGDGVLIRKGKKGFCRVVLG